MIIEIIESGCRDKTDPTSDKIGPLFDIFDPLITRRI